MYGESSKDYPIAVITLNVSNILSWGRESKVELPEPVEALCEDSRVKELVLSEIVRCSQLAQLRGFEVPKSFYLCPTPFDKLDCDALTPSLKLKRKNVAKYFKSQIDHLYSQPPMIARYFYLFY